MRFLRRSVFIVLAAVLLVGEGLADSDSEKVVARLTEVNNRIISGLVVLKANGALDAQGALSLIQTEASSLMDFNKLTRQAMASTGVRLMIQYALASLIFFAFCWR